MLKIGPHCRSGRVIVAPMAGVSDLPFRRLCRRFGVQWTISEMVTSDTGLWKSVKSRARLRFQDESEPRWVQIVGSEPAAMAEAARKNVDLGAQIIDINMGCPAKKVCRKAAGSALLRDEKRVGDILYSVVDAVDVPVTLKMRLGWSRSEINAVDIARIAEDRGVQLITVHGRTRACRFQGAVDYPAIAEVKAAVRIPVIANGDIRSAEDAAAVLEMTGADGVMIGRAAQGRPWLPGQVSAFLETGVMMPAPDHTMLRGILQQHIRDIVAFYGETQGVRLARKHVGWTLGALSGDHTGLRKHFCSLETMTKQLALIDEMFRCGGLLQKSGVQTREAA